MHLIIDIRSRHREDVYTIRYAKNWVQKWKKYNPYDICTFLIFDEQEAIESEKCFRVRPTSWFSGKRQLKSTHKNEIFRCVNFSRYAPYDPSIPTITHIFDMGRWFYDSEVNANILRRKEREFEIKKVLNTSSHIIVPNFFTGNELVELWNIDESKIDILPFIHIEEISTKEAQLHNIPIEEKFFLFDATYGGESNIENLIHSFEKYHKNGGKFHLVLHGNTGKNLTLLTDIIRKNGLEKYIHITGNLDNASHEELYNKAKCWIYTGAYNTTKTNIELANNKNLLLLLSDIPAFSFYKKAIKIHPNHQEELISIFEKIEKGDNFDLKENRDIPEELVMSHYKNIISQNPTISQ